MKFNKRRLGISIFLVFAFIVITLFLKNPDLTGNIIKDTANSDLILEEDTNFEGPIVVNEQVNVVKKIKLKESTNNLGVDLPKSAKIISVKKTNKDSEEEIKDKVRVEGEEFKTGENNLISGAVVADDKSFLNKVSDLFSGNKEENQRFIIGDSVEEVEIAYKLPGPSLEEEVINEYRKKITVSSDIHYENVLAYTDVIETSPGLVDVYRIVNGKKVAHDFKPLDTNGNGLIDRIEWIVPSLSTETFEVSILILNVYEYPKEGDNWTVYFDTNGKANLEITPLNSTFSEVKYDLSSTNDYIRFTNISCGHTSLIDDLFIISNGIERKYSEIREDESLVVDKLLLKNYECDETSSITSLVLIAGIAALEFDFGGVKAYAYDPSGACTGTLTVNNCNAFKRYQCGSGTDCEANTCQYTGHCSGACYLSGYCWEGSCEVSTDCDGGVGFCDYGVPDNLPLGTCRYDIDQDSCDAKALTACTSRTTEAFCNKGAGCSWDVCAYSGSGDYTIDCADNCVLSSTQSLPAVKLVASGSGTLTVTASIDINTAYIMPGCKLYIKGSGKVW